MSVRPKGYPYHTLIETYLSWGEDPGLAACLSGRRSGGITNFVRLVLALKRTEIHDFLGDYEQGQILAREALEYARAAGLSQGQAQALLQLAKLLAGKSEFARMGEAAEEALALFAAKGSLKGQAMALDNLGYMHYNLGDIDKAKASCLKALALFEALGDREGTVACLNNISYYCSLEGGFAESLRLSERALRLTEEIGDLYDESYCLITLGLIHGQMGNAALAREHQERALALHQTLRDRNAQAIALLNIATYDAHLGDCSKALTLSEQAHALFAGLGDRSGCAHALLHLGKVHAALGGFEKAVDYGERALEIFRRTGESRNQALSLLHLVSAHLEQGQSPKAQEALGEAARLSLEGNPDSPWLCYHAQSSAALALKTDDLAVAAQEIKTGLLLAEALSSRRYRALLLYLRARLKDKVGDWLASQADYTESVNLLGSLGDKAELAKVSYYFGKALLAHGEGEKGRWYLAEARRIWEAIGAKGWLAQMDSEGP